MNKALFNRRLRQLHLWFALAIGAQIGLWLISGLFMVWFPIEQVRGNYIKADIEAAKLQDLTEMLSIEDIIRAYKTTPETMTLKMFAGQPMWQLETNEQILMMDAKTGEIVTPLLESRARKIADTYYSGAGTFDKATYFTDPPPEYGHDGPVWRINYARPNAASFYVDASSGDVKAVRTGLWRTFDLMWGLHIMDWKERDNFNSWWVKMTASLAVIFFLTGLCLAFLRIKKTIRRARNP